MGVRFVAGAAGAWRDGKKCSISVVVGVGGLLTDSFSRLPDASAALLEGLDDF